MKTKFKVLALESLMPIHKIVDGGIISLHSDLTFGYELTLPEVFTLTEDEYDAISDSFMMALRALPDWTFVHRQDTYFHKEYNPIGSDFIFSRKYNEHFAGRQYLEERSYLFLTKTTKGSALRSNSKPGALGGEKCFNLPTEEEILSFRGVCEDFVSTLTKSGYVKARYLESSDYVGNDNDCGIIQQYMMLSNGSRLVSDIRYEPSFMEMEGKRAVGYCVGDSEDLLFSNAKSVIRSETLSNERASLYMSYGASLGMGLDCEHVLNQYILKPSQSYVDSSLDIKRRKSNSMISYGDNATIVEEIDAFEEAKSRNSSLAVFSSITVIAWGDPEDERQISQKIGNILTNMHITAKRAMFDMPVLWFSGIPGACCELGKDNLMLMEMESSVMLSNLDDYTRGFPKGVLYLCDRVRNIPVLVDLQGQTYEAKNYNAFVVGTSGSGKSFTMNYYLNALYEAGQSVFFIDVGDSYEGQCEIIREISGGADGLYYTWNAKDPLTFNPFIGYKGWTDDNGRIMSDSISLNSFIALMETLYVPDGGWSSQKENILMKIIEKFVSDTKDKGEDLPIFDDFISYIKKEISPAILHKKGCRKKFMVNDEEIDGTRFDISGFIVAMDAYTKGGRFDFLLNERHPKDIFASRFTGFEVKALSDSNDKKFYSVCILCIMNAFNEKMEKAPGWKTLLIDEAWKAIANETMAPYLRGLFKTSRKYQGSIIVVTQELNDVMSSNVIKDTIVANSENKYILQGASEMELKNMENMLGFNKKEMSQIRTLRRNPTPGIRSREIFFKISDVFSGVFTLEASRFQAWAFESNKDKKRPIYELRDKIGSLIEAIDEYIEADSPKS